MHTDIVVLAAGQGSRMKSALPKVLHPIGGKAMLVHVLERASAIANSALHVVVGHAADQVERALAQRTITIVHQTEQLGTGHAVAQAMPGLDPAGVTLILYGDVPLTRTETLLPLLECANNGQMGLLTVKLADPTGYGRIIRNDAGQVTAIVEQKDARPEQLAINEVNTGIMALATDKLLQWLPELSCDNAQGEYYLTDIIAMAARHRIEIVAFHPGCEQEVQGVNNRQQQAQLERWYQQQQAEQLMQAGVSLVDPARLDIRGTLTTGQDVLIDVNCVFEGEVTLEDGVVIAPNCILKNCHIGAGTQIKANSHLEGADIGRQCEIGPFARVRPATQLADHSKIGNFVETKKARIGQGSKVNHLSYIGDAHIGEYTNIGAGTITCNYDGVNKSLTEIGSHAFIGSNTALVAPVTIGDGATVGAGSTITKGVDDQQLAIARAKQRNLANWQRPQPRNKEQ